LELFTSIGDLGVQYLGAGIAEHQSLATLGLNFESCKSYKSIGDLFMQSLGAELAKKQLEDEQHRPRRFRNQCQRELLDILVMLFSIASLLWYSFRVCLCVVFA